MDNGSEFAKHFDDYCRDSGLTHFFNYPKHPESNSYLERFNRTIQEQCVNLYIDYLDEPDDFNRKLMGYLIWYNMRNRTGALATSHLCGITWITSSPTPKSPICYGRLQGLDNKTKGAVHSFRSPHGCDLMCLTAKRHRNAILVKERNMLLEGKTAIVTGSSKGLGRAFAMAMAQHGANVVVNGTVADDVARVVQEIRDAGGKATGCTASVATMAGADRIIRSAQTEFGRLDILVNNAGNLRDRTFLKMTEQEWDEVIAVHLKGTFACSKFAAQAMAEQQSGRIINITSGAAFRGNIGQANYSAAKAGIIGLSLTLAQELARYNITVNVVWPRAVTRMTQPVVDNIIERNRSGNVMEATALDVGLGPPEMVAPLVVFLACDESKGITGKIIGLRGETLSVLSQHKEVATATMIGGWTVEEIRKRFQLTVGTAL